MTAFTEVYHSEPQFHRMFIIDILGGGLVLCINKVGIS